MNRISLPGTRWLYGGALSITGKIEAIARRMEMKMQQGMQLFSDTAGLFREDAEQIAFPGKEACGGRKFSWVFFRWSAIKPLFMANEMPGVRIPPQITEATDRICPERKPRRSPGKDIC